jgi:retron-type reverse transcriptase
MSNAVNTTFVLDIQRKLYRWSNGDADKVFADLFNLVCDRRTLIYAWERLARNRGSQTPGTDGVTRRTVEMRSDGVTGFLDEIRATEITDQNLSGNGSSRSPANRESSARSAFPR